MSAHAKTILQKAAIYGAVIIFLAILQTSFFSRFNFFGATPDLMLAAVMAVAMFEGEKAGCVAGIGAGFLIDALGSVGLSVLPVFYMLCGAAAGLLCIRTFSRGPFSFIIFALVGYLARTFVTLMNMSFFWESFSLPSAIGDVLAPEYLSSVIFALLGFIAIRMPAKLFHRTKELNR